MPVQGTATKQITVGRYVLTVGAPAGTLIVPTRRAERHGRNELSEALSAAGAAELIEEAVEEGGDVAGRVERALELTTALAEGRLDRQIVLREADALVGLLARLDRDGRHEDALRLARALIALLALLGRWLALVQSLRLALRAARTIGDRAQEAWAHHEIGTFSLAGGDRQGAVSHLEAAQRIRQDLGDETGAQVTASNLVVARSAPPLSWMAIAIAGIVALVIAGVIAGILYARDGDDDVTTTAAGTTTGTTTGDSPPPPPPPRSNGRDHSRAVRAYEQPNRRLRVHSRGRRRIRVQPRRRRPGIVREPATLCRLGGGRAHLRRRAEDPGRHRRRIGRAGPGGSTRRRRPRGSQSRRSADNEHHRRLPADDAQATFMCWLDDASAASRA